MKREVRHDKARFRRAGNSLIELQELVKKLDNQRNGLKDALKKARKDKRTKAGEGSGGGLVRTSFTSKEDDTQWVQESQRCEEDIRKASFLSLSFSYLYRRLYDA